jgi:hypothetical protein
MTATLSSTLPAGKVEEFKSLFYSKDEWREVGQGVRAQEASGWKGALKANLQMAAIPKIKDPVLLDDMLHRLAIRKLDFDDTRFSGYYTIDDTGAACLDLIVRCKQPSFIYRLIFDEYVDVPLRIRCSDAGGSTVLTVEHVLERAIDVVGCIITVVLLFAFIVPGLVWMYITRAAKKVRLVVQKDVVFEALRERLGGK